MSNSSDLTWTTYEKCEKNISIFMIKLNHDLFGTIRTILKTDDISESKIFTFNELSTQ